MHGSVSVWSVFMQEFWVDIVTSAMFYDLFTHHPRELIALRGPRSHLSGRNRVVGKTRRRSVCAETTRGRGSGEFPCNI
jgi:hypothetical protein